MDQLQRAEALPTDKFAELTRVLDRAAGQISAGEPDTELSRELSTLAKGLEVSDSNGSTRLRQTGLVDTLTGIASRLE